MRACTPSRLLARAVCRIAADRAGPLRLAPGGLDARDPAFPRVAPMLGAPASHARARFRAAPEDSSPVFASGRVGRRRTRAHAWRDFCEPLSPYGEGGRTFSRLNLTDK